MVTAGEVKVRITGDMADLQTALRRASNSTEQATGKMQRDFAALGRTVARVGVGMATAIAAGVAFSVREAAAAEEIRGKFNTVFRGIEDDTRAWAETTADAVSRSSIALEEYLSTFQDTFVPLGFARAEAGEFSRTLTQLAIDLASFNDESEPDTVRALQSAIVGNHETVRRYGVIINQAGLEQELLNMGIQGGADAATAAEMAMARLNIILEGTTDAQGDAARTSESASNQWRGFTAELRDAAVAIGDSFMPAALELLDWARELIPLVEGIGTAFGNATAYVAEFFDRLTPDSPEVVVQNATNELRALAGASNTAGNRAFARIGNRNLEPGSDAHAAALAEAEGHWNRRDALYRQADEMEQRLAQNVGRTESAIARQTATIQQAETPIRVIAAATREAADATEDMAEAEAALSNKIKQAGGLAQAREAVAAAAAEMAAEMEAELAQFQSFADGVGKELEDVFVQFARSGRFEISNLVDYIVTQFARLAFQQTLADPLSNLFSSFIGGDPISKAVAKVATGGSGPKASGGQMTVYNIDARYATESTADMIVNAIQANNPGVIRQAVGASVQTIGQRQNSMRAA